jgi:hypothetical protein
LNQKCYKETASALQEEVIRAIAASNGISLPDDQVNALLNEEASVEPLALVAYGTQLVRRLNGEEADPSSLVLWRRFAWQKSGPKKDFILTGETILGAEKAIESRIQDLHK